MPHLTRPQQRAPGTELRPGVGVPGYAHPLLARAEWGELTRPGTPLHWVVLNVADGPGARPDPHCLEAAGRLRNAGVRVLGHLDTRYGTRSFGEVVSDAHRFVDWYQVDGFLLERCPADHVGLPEVRRTVAALRMVRDEAHIVLGHGIHPHPGTPTSPTSWSPSPDRGATTAGPRWPSGPPSTNRSASATSCTACPGPIWRRRCASPAGRGLRRSGSPTTPTAVAGSTPGRPCPATGTTSSRWSERVSRNEKGHGSVTGRTTVVIDRPTESPCRCHPWSSRLPSSP